MSYYKKVIHPVSGQTVLVSASTQVALANKLRALETRWSKELSRSHANLLTEEAQTELTNFRSILAVSLKQNYKVDWKSLKRKASYKAPPKQEDFAPTYLDATVLAWFKGKSTKLVRQQAEEAYQNALKTYEEEKAIFLAQQEEKNRKAEAFKLGYENHNSSAVEQYMLLVLVLSKYPKGVLRKPQVKYEPHSRLMLIEIDLPSPDLIPRVTEYSYSPTKDSFTTKTLKQKEFDEFYESVLYQIALRTLHEVFESDYTDAIHTVGLNGYVSGTDPKNGQDFRNCILSLQVDRAQFNELRLDRISPYECFRHLKGVTAGSLAMLAPVRPILQLNTNDKRIIKAQAVIDSATGENLASMDWVKFEVLIRDLFEKEFGDNGAKVEVTRASRDEGVDALAYDPDPIRGGKFVIQAKRYNHLVPVSAVRDLYGTVLNEGAVKGILVTTSYYGSEAREFAKNKPLTLIAGDELIFLFNKHGYRVNIQLQRKRAGLL